MLDQLTSQQGATRVAKKILAALRLAFSVGGVEQHVSGSISKLKIDQSFVRDITVDPNDSAIVVAIISMARSLDLDVIAEGIETAEQLALLRAQGCRVGQGFYFSVPMSADDLAPVLASASIFDHLRSAPAP